MKRFFSNAGVTLVLLVALWLWVKLPWMDVLGLLVLLAL